MQHAIAQHSAATAAPARASLRRAAPARAAVRVHAQRVGAAAATGTYVAVNRYRLVDPSTQSAFEAEVAARAKAAAAQPGYVSHEVSRDAPVGGQAEYTVTQSWASKAEYEAWFNTPFRRRSHFPAGVWQHLPANKFSVPEEFCPYVRSKAVE